MKQSIRILRAFVLVGGFSVLAIGPHLPRVEAQCETGNTSGCYAKCVAFDDDSADCSSCCGSSGEDAMTEEGDVFDQTDDDLYTCPGGASCTPSGYFNEPAINDSSCCIANTDDCFEGDQCCQPSGSGNYYCPGGGVCCIPLGFSQSGHCVDVSDCCTPSGEACVSKTTYGQCCILPGYYDNGSSANCCTGNANGDSTCACAASGSACYGNSSLCCAGLTCNSGTCS
jgi:hypothetical protein